MFHHFLASHLSLVNLAGQHHQVALAVLDSQMYPFLQLIQENLEIPLDLEFLGHLVNLGFHLTQEIRVDLFVPEIHHCQVFRLALENLVVPCFLLDLDFLTDHQHLEALADQSDLGHLQNIYACIGVIHCNQVRNYLHYRNSCVISYNNECPNLEILVAQVVQVHHVILEIHQALAFHLNHLVLVDQEDLVHLSLK